MDQVKIGRFICTKRKEKKLTQSKLAELLGITDRAISKWETGVCMPDSGIISELCNILGITINDLFSGEVVDMKQYEKKTEENLLKLKKDKEETDKKLLRMEIIIGYISSVSFMILVFVASFIQMDNIFRILLISLGLIIFVTGVFSAVRIEQVAGYYECKVCKHKYIPIYNNVLFSMHFGRTRYMKCPKCGTKSWQKKKINNSL